MNLDQTVLHKEKKMKDKKILQEEKNIFNSLKFDPNSVLFSEEKIEKHKKN